MARSLFGVIFLICAGASVVRAADATAGVLKRIEGGVAIRRGDTTLAGREGLGLLASDVVETADNGGAALLLLDGTRISLGPRSVLVLREFVYAPSEGRFALVLNLARGVMVYISGKVAQYMPGSVKVETPVGVIGLRGTEFAVQIEGE